MIHRTVLFSSVLLLTLIAQVAGARDLPDFTELVKKYSPAVVNVSTVQASTQRRSSGSPELDEFFRRFFPPGQRGNPFGGQRRSLGSGFIISSDGFVLTNNHVVEDADEIVVRLSDRRELEATLVGADPRSDLALLKIDAEDLPAVQLGRSDALEVGEWVLAIGSPFGFDYSVTAGIVSAKGRSLPNENNENYVPFIQTDVAINPGNSGGPLFDLDGRVVGINSQIYTRSGGFMGVSFAIPIDVAMGVVEQLKTDGRVSRGWLGVVIQDVNRDLAESFGLAKPGGALVARVLDGGPADIGGLKEGDIIVTFNGSDVDLSSDLPHLVGRSRAGGDVEVVIVREGKRKTLQVTVGELADDQAMNIAASDSASTPSPLGLVVEELNEASRQRANTSLGVRVVESTGPAHTAGIRQGDIITRLNNQEVDSIDTFNDVLADLERGRSVPVLIVRGQSPTFLALRVPDD